MLKRKRLRTFLRKIKRNTETCFQLINGDSNTSANIVDLPKICEIKPREFNNSEEVKKYENTVDEYFPSIDTENGNNDFSNSDIAERFVFPNIQSDISLLEDNTIDFLDSLRKWAIMFNVPHESLRQLLSLLKTIHANVPNDPRTLLRTPRKICLKNIEPGAYAHFGLKFAIEHLISHVDSTLSCIELLINVDGLPLSKSSNSQIYPILCSLFKYPHNVSVIGIYHGYEKPTSANELLTDFVQEVIDLMNNGFISQGKCLPFEIKGFICDAPAKSFITYCKGHSGFYSCTKCIQKGKYIKGRVSFIHNNSPKRTDDTFRCKLQPEHHNGISILENIPHFGMVTKFPLEYMHLICLGVVKKLLLNIWFHGKPSHKLSNECLKNISDLLVSIKNYVPVEFVRKTRSLHEVTRWKATELRFILLYSGPIVFKNLISEERYLHFLSLHVAIRILSCTELCKMYITFAHNLLLYFVDKVKVFMDMNTYLITYMD